MTGETSFKRSACGVLWSAALLVGCASESGIRELHGEGLGSRWIVKIAGAVPVESRALQNGIQARVDSVADQLSRWDSSSALSVLNSARDEEWHALPPQLNKSLRYALDLASSTGGAYDPTVAPLVDVWGFGTGARRYSPPSSDEIAAARAQVGYSKVELDPEASRVRRPAGTQIDLSSMTHGLAADQVAEYLQSIGLTRFLVDVGSELRAHGDSLDGEPWHVAIERPPSELSQADDGGAPIHIIGLRDAGIATSGNYRYFFDYNGRRYSHRIDPRTAEPIPHPLAAVTVIDPECMHADALATALTVLGPDEGFEYAQQQGIAALFILRTQTGLEERMTPAFRKHLRQ